MSEFLRVLGFVAAFTVLFCGAAGCFAGMVALGYDGHYAASAGLGAGFVILISGACYLITWMSA